MWAKMSVVWTRTTLYDSLVPLNRSRSSLSPAYICFVCLWWECVIISREQRKVQVSSLLHNTSLDGVQTMVRTTGDTHVAQLNITTQTSLF